jgi:hypothetical protein
VVRRGESRQGRLDGRRNAQAVHRGDARAVGQNGRDRASGADLRRCGNLDKTIEITLDVEQLISTPSSTPPACSAGSARPDALPLLHVSGTARIEDLAVRHKCSIRHINMTISMAFLAPGLVKAAIEGRLPQGIGVCRIA